MLTWLTNNAGTVLITLCLMALAAVICRKLIRDRRQGKSACGGHCGACPMSGACHKKP